MFQANQWFPQGHALGEVFYNREAERKRLSESFLNHEHIVLVAPRRYGKSSLIQQVLLENKIVGQRMDLLPASNAAFVQKAIKVTVSGLMTQLLPKTKKAQQVLIEWLKRLHPKLILSLFGQTLEISTTESPEENISDLLVSLDQLAKKMNQRVVLCFDEFQQVGALKEHHAIEASIRHAVEKSTHVTYIFSGSIQHLLHRMFSSKNRPLYRLCELMELKRISSLTYTSILLGRAKKKWGKVGEDMIHEILNVTQRHPYYVNALCRLLWGIEKVPSVPVVQTNWLAYITSQMHWIEDDLSRLTPNQRHVLAGLAYQAVDAPYSHEFSQRLHMTPANIRRALTSLLEQDFVYIDQDKKYKVLDPALAAYLRHVRAFNFEAS